MKNIMRRTVAFMLMACLLLSVMAPASLLKVEAAVGDQTSYSYVETEGSSLVTKYAYYGRSALSGSNLQTKSWVKGNWVALQFTVKEAGIYDMSLKLTRPSSGTNTEVNIYFVPATTLKEDEDTSNNATIEALTAMHQVTVTKSVIALTEVCISSTDPYLMIIEKTSDTGSNMNFSGFTLTQKSSPNIVAEANGVYSYSVNYNVADLTIDSKNWITYNNDKMGDFVYHAASSACLQKSADGDNAYAAAARFKENSYLAMNFIVTEPGTYDLSLGITTTSANAFYINDDDVPDYAKGVEVYIKPATEWARATNNESNNNAAAALQGGTSLKIVSKSEERHDINNVTFPAAGSYVIIFKSVTTGLMRFSGMTMKCHNVAIGENTYGSVASAIAAKEADATLTGDITLTGAITEKVVLTEGITLNLNGKEIYGGLAANGGQIVGEGYVSGTLDATGNQQLPLSDGDGNYKFFAPETVSPQVNANDYWFDVKLSDEAYKLIATGESGMTVDVDITWKTSAWTKGDPDGKLELAGNVTDWATGEIDGGNYGLCVRFADIPVNVSDVQVTVTYSANGASVVYTSAVAANG